MSTTPAFTFYRNQSAMSEPGKFGWLYEDLPYAIPTLVQTVRQSLLHIFWAERYGVQLDDARKSEVAIRPVKHKLARLLEIDSRPLSEPRPLERRLVGNCRDFTLFTVSLLRHAGIPARSRCGFALYFIPDHYEDHWVAEYWDSEQSRWVMLDAQMDEFQQGVLQLHFDPLDMPPGQFVTGGAAWLLARRGQADPDKFGIFDMKGMDFIKGNLLRDLLALNKFEVLPWDFWGILQKAYEEHTPGELDQLDRAAELTCSENFSAIRAAYQSTPEFIPPDEWSD